MSRILVKAIKPHRQKILNEAGDEMRLQQFANRRASAEGLGAGDQFVMRRDEIMRDALMNPERYNIKFLDNRIPFEGMEPFEERTSVPDVEAERASMEAQSEPESVPTPALGADPIMESPNRQSSLMEFRDEESARKRPGVDLFDAEGKLKGHFMGMNDAWSLLKRE